MPDKRTADDDQPQPIPQRTLANPRRSRRL